MTTKKQLIKAINSYYGSYYKKHYKCRESYIESSIINIELRKIIRLVDSINDIIELIPVE